jgi:hypothetical protein
MDSKMEGKFSSLESKIEGKFSSLETLLGLLIPKNVADPDLSKNVPQDAPTFEALTPTNASKKAEHSQDESPSLSHPVEIIVFWYVCVRYTTHRSHTKFFPDISRLDRKSR